MAGPINEAKYVLVKADVVDGKFSIFEDIVTDKINSGFVLIGGIDVKTISSNAWRLTQAMYGFDNRIVKPKSAKPVAALASRSSKPNKLKITGKKV